MNRLLQALAICLIGAALASVASAQTYEDMALTKSAAKAQITTATTATTIVFLGTGMPAPDPKRQGPSFVVEAGGNTYLFDMGVGLMRQARAANVNISPPTAAFLSHLHTDHTLGLPDLMFTPWSAGGAPSSFPLYGPVGLQWMVNNIQSAYTQDICVRDVCQMLGKNNYLPPVVTEIKLSYPTGGPTPPPTGASAPTCTACTQKCPAGKDCTCGAELPKSAPQQVYADSAVKVSAFLVRHGCWDEALGYVIETLSDHKRIVYSGDTRYVANMGAACNGCDVLIHELYWGKGEPACGSYMTCFHTTMNELEQVFKEGKPKKLVVVHQVGLPTPGKLVIPKCSSTETSGCVMFAKDLETIIP